MIEIKIPRTLIIILPEITLLMTPPKYAEHNTKIVNVVMLFLRVGLKFMILKELSYLLLRGLCRPC